MFKKHLGIFSLILAFIQLSYAKSIIKIVCDLDNEKIYVDGKLKAECFKNESLDITVPAGKHTIVVKKYNGDGIYYYFERKIYLSNGVKLSISVNTKLVLSEDFYYKKALKSQSINDYWKYLERYPNGKYAQKVRNYLDDYYWKRCNSINNCKEYLNKIKWGKHKSQAKAKIEEMYANCSSISSCEKYLSLYPNGKYSNAVRKKLAKLKLQKEETDFKYLCNSINGCKSYLEKYSDGKYVEQAKKKLNMFICQQGDLLKCVNLYNKGKIKNLTKLFLKYTGLKMWDKVKSLKIRYTGDVRLVAFSPDGKYLAIGSHEGTIRIYNTNNWKKIKKFKVWFDNIFSIAFSSDGKYLAIGGKNGTVRVYDTNNWEEIKKIKTWGFIVSSIAFSPDGRYLAIGGWDYTARIYRVDNWKMIRIFLFKGQISSMAFSPDSKYFVVSSWDKTVRIYDTRYWGEVQWFTFKSFYMPVTFSPDGKYLAIEGRIYSTHSWKEVQKFKGDAVVFSPDGKYLAVGRKIYNTHDWKEVQRFKGNEIITFSPDSKYLVVGQSCCLDIYNREYFVLSINKYINQNTDRYIYYLGSIISLSRDKTIYIFELKNFSDKEIFIPANLKVKLKVRNKTYIVYLKNKHMKLKPNEYKIFKAEFPLYFRKYIKKEVKTDEKL